MRIRVLREGKARNPHLRALEAEYAARIARFTDIVLEDVTFERKAPARRELSGEERRLIEKLRGSVKILLDPTGREWTSEAFAEWLEKQAAQGTRELAFMIGGADGFSQAWRKEADVLLALSRMTFTHEWARAILLEQIYRGFTMLRGFPYAR